MCEYNSNKQPENIIDPNNYLDDFELELLSRDNICNLTHGKKVFYLGINQNELSIKQSGDFEKADFSKCCLLLNVKDVIKEYSMKEYFFYYSTENSAERSFMVDLLKALETGKIKKRDKTKEIKIKKKRTLNF